MSLLMMFAKCGDDLMNASVSVNQRNMKEDCGARRGVAHFNYLSGESLFHVLIKTVLTSAGCRAASHE